MMTENRVPTVFPPGEIIKDELDARGWTQADLAAVLGRPPKLVNEVLAGKRAITPETAQGLADAFDTSAEMWMNLESQFQLHQARRVDANVSRRARLFSTAPVKEMERRGWIAVTKTVEELEAQLCEFFRVPDLSQLSELPHAPKKSTSYAEPLSAGQRAWVTRVRQIGASVDAGPYRDEALESVLSAIRSMLQAKEDVRHVPRLLAEAGIRLVIVEHLKGTRIDGVCTWLDASSPVIGLSLRFDRIDSFWFVLVHELEHVRKRAGLGEAVVDVDLVGERAVTSNTSEVEAEANRVAASTLISPAELDGFVARVRPMYSRGQILGFAARLKLHPGLVVGQLQHRGEISYSYCRDLLAKVRDTVVGSAMSDGWGHVPGVIAGE